MAAAHMIIPQIPISRVTAVNLGAGNAANQRFKDVDAGKIVKLVATDRYDLAAIGDKIEGIVVGVETATSNGYSVGGIKSDEKAFATADGIQVDGTGSIAVGDYVVTGAVTALGTAMEGYPKVRKATSQTYGPFTWRVVSLQGGNGSVGTTLVIERI